MRIEPFDRGGGQSPCANINRYLFSNIFAVRLSQTLAVFLASSKPRTSPTSTTKRAVLSKIIAGKRRLTDFLSTSARRQVVTIGKRPRSGSTSWNPRATLRNSLRLRPSRRAGLPGPGGRAYDTGGCSNRCSGFHARARRRHGLTSFGHCSGGRGTRGHRHRRDTGHKGPYADW